jgi:hypothetical protein
MLRIRGIVAVVVVSGVIGAGAVGAAAATLDKKGSPVSADKYVSSLCTSLGTWLSDLQSASSGISAKLANATGVSDAKKVLVSFLQSTVTRTDKLVKQVDNAGVPKVKNGAALAKTFHDGLAKARSVFQKAATDAKNLSGSSASRFTQGASKISTAITSGSSGVAGAFSAASAKYPSPEFNAAANNNASCASLGSSSSTSTSSP